MDLKDLTLPNIYQSIESSLKTLKLQHEEICFLSEEPSKIHEFVDDVLKPMRDCVSFQDLTCLSAVQNLLTTYQTHIEKEKTNKNNKNRQVALLPRVAQLKPTAPATPRPRSTPTSVCYPAISSRLTRSPSKSCSFIRPSLLSINETAPPSTDVKQEVVMNLKSIERCQRLNRFVVQTETRNCKLQEMFTTFTQRVLVPLQVFCKHTRSRKKLKSEKDVSEDVLAWQKKTPKDSDQSEFALVELLNRIRQLLWLPNDIEPEKLFTSDNQFLSTEDRRQFAVVAIHYDVLTKFAVVLNCASLWLKRDQIYTENAKCGFLRAHRRFVKVQRMWQQARQIQRDLSIEWNQTICQIETNESRLETLQNEMETLKKTALKLQDERQTVEIKLSNAIENIDRMRATHRNLRKQINSSCRRLEARERTCELVMSRVRSFKADKEAVLEKIRINREFVESLQKRMISLYHDREAWKQRYEEKTDPKVLEARMKSVGLRIPSLIVREKTFVLKSRTENLQEAFSIIQDRLKASDTHWSSFCHQLNWPQAFLNTLLSSNPRIRRRAFYESTSSSLSASCQSENTSAQSTNGKTVSPPKSPATQRIVNYVNTNCQGPGDDCCLFMLNLWLEKNGPDASLGQLVSALKEVRRLEKNSVNELDTT